MSVVVPLAVMFLAVALARLESGLLGRPGVAPARIDTAGSDTARSDTASPVEQERTRMAPAPPGPHRDLVAAAAR